MINILKLIFTILILIEISISCNFYEDSQKKRADYALSSENDIFIAAVGLNNNTNLFIDGIKLAAKQINKRSGLLGKNIKLKIYDYENSIKKSKSIAYKIANNPKIFAVIGYPESITSIPAAITFEKNGILFISTGLTFNSFKQYDFLYSFRNVPSNKTIAEQIALFAKRNNYNRLVSFIDLNVYRQKLSNFFHEAALKQNLQIVYQKTYFSWQSNFKQTLAEIKRDCKFDAIFLNGHISSAAAIIKEARQLGIQQPFITNFSFDSSLLWEYVGNDAAGTIVPTVFDPRHTNSKTIKFVKAFRNEYECLPDSWAALGYDALNSIEMAVNNASSLVPFDVASSLKLINNFEGVTGNFSFELDKKLSKYPIFFKTASDNIFIYKEQDLYTGINVDEVIEERTLRLPISSEFTTIDPGRVIEQNSIELCEQIFLGLTDFSKDIYQPVSEFAKKWTVSSDGIFYTFFLRDDVKWTDGKKVTAYDVEWAIQRNINPKLQSVDFGYLDILKNAKDIKNGVIKDIKELGVNAIDNYTIKFSLEHPAAYFPSISGLPVYRPLPRHIIEKYPDQWTDVDKIVTNGSYKIVYWDKEKLVILKKNRDYYESEKVSIPEIRYNIIKNNNLGFLLYKQNELDVLGNSFLKIPSDELFTVKTNPIFINEYKEVPLFQVDTFLFNMSIPPFNNVLIRKAFVASINRELIINMVSKGNFEVAKTLTTPQNNEEKGNLYGKGINFSLTNVKKWLSQAGYSDLKNCGDIHLVTNESKKNNEIAMALKESLSYYLNINVVPSILPWEDYINLLKNPKSQKWHILKIGFNADYPDPNNWLNDLIFSLPEYNTNNWYNKEYLDLIKDASKEIDPHKRKTIYQRIEEIICKEDCIIAPIFYDAGHYLIKPRVKGWYNMAFGGQHIRNWSLDH